MQEMLVLRLVNEEKKTILSSWWFGVATQIPLCSGARAEASRPDSTDNVGKRGGMWREVL